MAGVNENDLSMWELGMYDDYEDQEDLILIYKNLSKLAKTELVRLSMINFADQTRNIIW